jgi:hypothetical protein
MGFVVNDHVRERPTDEVRYPRFPGRFRSRLFPGSASRVHDVIARKRGRSHSGVAVFTQNQAVQPKEATKESDPFSLGYQPGPTCRASDGEVRAISSGGVRLGYALESWVTSRTLRQAVPPVSQLRSAILVLA